MSPVLRQRIFEARYAHGYRYLDRCGDAMLILESLLEKETGHIWLPIETVPTGARITCPELDVTILFNTTRLVVDQHPVDDPAVKFHEIAGAALSTIVGRFDLRKMERWGARRVNVLGADSLDEAEALSLRHRAAPVPNGASDDLKPRSAEFTHVYETDNRLKGVRLLVQPYAEIGVEIRIDDRLKQPPHLLHTRQREALLDQLRRQNQRQKDPKVGLAIDIDYYRVEPPQDMTVANFISEANSEADSVETQLLTRRTQ